MALFVSYLYNKLNNNILILYIINIIIIYVV